MRLMQTRRQSEELTDSSVGRHPRVLRATTSQEHAPWGPLLGLQREHGNQFVQRFLATAMSPCSCGGTCAHCRGESEKPEDIAVSQPGDVYEQEADRVANQVMSMGVAAPKSPDDEGIGSRVDEGMPAPDEEMEAAGSPPTTAIVPAACGACHGPEAEEEIHRKADGPAPSHASADAVVNGEGQPMSRALRDYFEPRFGYSFDQVKIHTDSTANASARSYNALAYTFGSNIIFGAGQFRPDTAAGKLLLAHELTHVVQQGAAGASGPARQAGIQRKTGMLIQRWTVCDGDPSLNTIICNGSGVIDVQLGGTGNANQTTCLSDCMRKHEESHKADALAANSKICVGQTAGKIPCFSGPAEQKPSEIKASNVEIDCLKLKKPNASATCKPIIESRITQMIGYRDSFK